MHWQCSLIFRNRGGCILQAMEFVILSRLLYAKHPVSHHGFELLHLA
jgi:hypothetical protein